MPDAIEHQLKRLQAFARANIPVAAAMQIEFLAYLDGELTVGAPLAANINHHGTAFGGSQYALVAVGGWGSLKLTLADAGLSGDAVIHSAEVTYERPAVHDLRAVCRVVQPERFLARCRKHGKAKADVVAEVLTGDQSAMRFEGRFFVTVEHPAPRP